MDPVDLGGVAEDAVELYQPLAEERGLALELKPHGAARVMGNRQLLFQAVANLIDNAVKYGHAGPAIIVEIGGGPAGPKISVTDFGPGIPPGERGHVLDRFVRLDPSRTTPGSGLGLSLVAAIARQHAATLELTDTQPGRSPPGLKVVLRFPPLPPQERPALAGPGHRAASQSPPLALGSPDRA